MEVGGDEGGEVGLGSFVSLSFRLFIFPFGYSLALAWLTLIFTERY